MTIDLSEGERLLAEATPGPWESVPLESGGFDVTTVPSRSGYSRAFGLVAKDAGGDDADAIVWLRNNAHALIQRARDAERYEPIIRDLAELTCLSACDVRMPRDNNPATACKPCRARTALEGK